MPRADRDKAGAADQLHIPGLAFALPDPDPLKPEYPIQMVTGRESFLRSWRVTPNTAALLDLSSVLGEFEYIAWAVRTAPGPLPLVPFRLVFQAQLKIHNNL